MVPYEEMKGKLLSYYDSLKVGGKTYYRNLLKQIKKSHDESYGIFGARLSSNCKRAYPNSNKECARKLREHFLAAIPNDVATRIKDTELVMRTTGKEKHLSFNTMVDLASRMAKGMEEEQQHRVMWTNYGTRSQEGSHESENRANRQDNNRSLPPSRVFRRSPTKPSQALYCDFCKNSGHSRKFCRRLLGQCLICGNENHGMINCPNYDPSRVRNRARNSPNANGRNIEDGRKSSNSNALPVRGHGQS